MVVLIKMVKNNLSHSKTISVILIFFISTTCFLFLSGENTSVQMLRSINNTLSIAQAPDFVQLESEKINKAEIRRWSSQINNIDKVQIVEMLNVSGSRLLLSKNRSESASIMNFDFVKQNKLFDFLLNLKNEIIHVLPGEVAVPIYFMQKNNLYS